MTAAQVDRWSRIARVVLAHVPGKHTTHRLKDIGEKMGGADLSYVRRLVFGTRGGAWPDTIYAFGEAAYEAGVPWSSGLLMLAVTEPYRTHAFGTFGAFLNKRSHLQEAWGGLMRVLATDAQNLELVIASAEDASALAFAKSTRKVIVEAWNAWNGSERLDGMPDILRAYLAMRKATVTTLVTQEFFLARRSVENLVLEWMRRVERDWARMSGDFAATDVDLDEWVGYRGLHAPGN